MLSNIAIPISEVFADSVVAELVRETTKAVFVLVVLVAEGLGTL